MVIVDKVAKSLACEARILGFRLSSFTQMLSWYNGSALSYELSVLRDDVGSSPIDSTKIRSSGAMARHIRFRNGR